MFLWLSSTPNAHVSFIDTIAHAESPLPFTPSPCTQSLRMSLVSMDSIVICYTNAIYGACNSIITLLSIQVKPHFIQQCTLLYVFLLAAPTDLSLVILSGASLEVKWEPAPYADQNLKYTVTAEGVSVETKRVTITPGDSSVTLSSLQELAVYNVSVQAVNSGGPSRSLTAAVRMVTVGQLGRTRVQAAFAVFSVERLF